MFSFQPHPDSSQHFPNICQRIPHPEILDIDYYNLSRFQNDLTPSCPTHIRSNSLPTYEEATK